MISNAFEMIASSPSRGSDKRKKIAIVAVARRLLVKLWAMLRDNTEWTQDKISVNQAPSVPSVAAMGAT
jgi:hypothetical protein